MKKLVKIFAVAALAAMAFVSCKAAVDETLVKSSKTMEETIKVPSYASKGWGDVNHLPKVENAAEGSSIEVYFNKGPQVNSWGYQVRMMLGDEFGDFAYGTNFVFKDLEDKDAEEIESKIENIPTQWGPAPNIINKSEMDYAATPAGKGKVLIRIPLSADNGGNNTLDAFKNGKVTFLAEPNSFIVEKMVLVSAVSADGVPEVRVDKEIKIPADGVIPASEFDKYSDDAVVTVTVDLAGVKDGDNGVATTAVGTIGYIRGKDGKPSKNDTIVKANGSAKIYLTYKKADVAELLKTGGITFVPEKELYVEIDDKNYNVWNEKDPKYPNLYMPTTIIPGGWLKSDDDTKYGNPSFYIDPKGEETAYRSVRELGVDDDGEYVYDKESCALKPVTTMEELFSGIRLFKWAPAYDDEGNVTKYTPQEQYSVSGWEKTDDYDAIGGYYTIGDVWQPLPSSWNATLQGNLWANRKLDAPEYIPVVEDGKCVAGKVWDIFSDPTFSVNPTYYKPVSLEKLKITVTVSDLKG